MSLYSHNRWEWVVAYHGELKAGAVVNPLNVMLTPEVRDCGAAAVFTSAEQAPVVAGLTRDLPELQSVVSFGSIDGVASDDVVAFDEFLAADGPVPEVGADPASPCTIGYTSGTTGHPKGAVQPTGRCC